jgi:hypothetical protein
VRSTILRPETNYDPNKGISVKGISDAILKTEGTVVEIIHHHARDSSLISRHGRVLTADTMAY